MERRREQAEAEGAGGRGGGAVLALLDGAGSFVGAVDVSESGVSCVAGEGVEMCELVERPVRESIVRVDTQIQEWGFVVDRDSWLDNIVPSAPARLECSHGHGLWEEVPFPSAGMALFCPAGTELRLTALPVPKRRRWWRRGS